MRGQPFKGGPWCIELLDVVAGREHVALQRGREDEPAHGRVCLGRRKRGSELLPERQVHGVDRLALQPDDGKAAVAALCAHVRHGGPCGLPALDALILSGPRFGKSGLWQEGLGETTTTFLKAGTAAEYTPRTCNITATAHDLLC